MLARVSTTSTRARSATATSSRQSRLSRSSIPSASIVALGDGTYAVRFFKSGQEVYERIDADLPTYSWSTTTLAYNSFGVDGSMWAPMIEKAFAYFRRGLNTYASISA